MSTPKTWIELLGDDASRCYVDGLNIVRHPLPGFSYSRVRLWTAGSEESARSILEAWKKEIAKKMKESIK